MEDKDIKFKIRTEILDRRNQERLTQLESSNLLKSKDILKSEGIEFFEKSFNIKVVEIENHINELQPGDLTALSNQINEICNVIQELQKYFTNSSFFLNSYEMKKYQKIINDLTIKLETEKLKLIPKKKFGFKTKSATTITSETALAPQSKINKIALASETAAVDWTIFNRSNELIILDDINVNDKDLTISNVSNCVIKIFGHPASIQIENLNNCIVVSGPVARSIFVNGSSKCKFAFACQQLRFHTSTFCDIYLHVTSRAIIEDCQSIMVAQYNFKYENLEKDFDKSGLDDKRNNWNDLDDFNWLSTDCRSPNWKVIDESERITDWIEYVNNFIISSNIT